VRPIAQRIVRSSIATGVIWAALSVQIERRYKHNTSIRLDVFSPRWRWQRRVAIALHPAFCGWRLIRSGGDF
jgi:hypothetical protein